MERVMTEAHVLVIGAGPAGLRAALDLADLGAQVTVVERRSAPGGTLTQLDVQYPTVDCGACQMHDSLAGPPWAERRCLRTGISHPSVRVLSSTTVTAAEREGAAFAVTVEQRQQWIDASKCDGCGRCAEVCPRQAPDSHEEGTCQRRAAYRRHPLAESEAFVIDESLCDQCGECLPVCPHEAIELGRPAVTEQLRVDAVVLATGFAPFDPRLQPQWAYGRDPDVVTALELERLVRPQAEGGLTPLRRPSNGEPAQRVAFVQCVGSRDDQRPYCSSVCCMHALKEAILLREKLGVEQCDIYAIDVRCVGKGYEETFQRALDAGVRVVHARPGAVESNGQPLLRVEYPGEGQKREPYDVVVLSTGMVPPPSLAPLADALELGRNEHGFVQTAPPSLVHTNQPGVFVCGAASGPTDLPWSVTEASQAALAAALHCNLVPLDEPRSSEQTAELRRAPRRVGIEQPAVAGSGPQPERHAVNRRALVLGAGPAGLAAARVLGRAGIPVTVAEKRDVAGGNLRNIHTGLAGTNPPALLEELLREVEENQLIDLRLETELTEHRGGPGRYVAQLRNLRDNKETRLRHGALIVATGAHELQLSSEQYGYSGPSGPVMTQLELEQRLASDEGLLDSTATPTVVMIQCVGSREPQRPTCSRICCQAAVKHALALKQTQPGARVIVLHRDLRTVGLDEQAHEEARAKGVVFLRFDPSQPPQVERGGRGATVRVMDPMLRRTLRIDADLVVLSAGVEPNLSEAEATKLGLERVAGGFASEANAKFRPVEAARRGLLVAGTALAPQLLPEALAQGEAAALRAVALLTRDQVMPRPGAVAYRAAWCARCGLCVTACPAGARELNDDDETSGAIVHPGLCQGCGNCVAACPSGCTEQPDLNSAGVMALIEAALEVVS
jgi:heterodisulfide reductase subunit A-like polyferredoxin